jgi:phosphopantothenoylcysteine decarboxylase/phosphopantothenate--cysteine ligase
MARVLITSGPTREAIDPVRFIANASSGRMGRALAAAALALGHTVEVVTGPAEVAPPPGARITRVETARQMLAACERLHPSCDVLIGAAAVCDYRPAAPLAEKRRRDASTWTLELIANPDVLATLGRVKGSRVHVGFALETGPLAGAHARAREKLAEKNLDWIVLNAAETIGGDRGAYWLLARDGSDRALGERTKEELARHLVPLVTARSREA